MIKKYLKFKNSKVDWIGKIPDHWNITSIKNILEIPITDGPHTTPKLYDKGIPFISAEAIKNGKIDFSKKRGYISEEDYKTFSQKYVPQLNDIYMVKSGATTGNIAKVETEKIFTIWSPLAVFRSNTNKVIHEYLFLFLQSSNFKTSVEVNWSYGTQQNIGMGVLGNLPILYPTLPEQTQIAKYLDYQTNIIDRLIEKKEKLVILLQEQRKSIINEAVTKGLDPNAKMKDSGIEWLGEIPEGWISSSIKNVSNVKGRIGFRGYTTNDLVKEGEGALTLGATHLTSTGKINLNKAVYISWDKYEESPEIKLDKGDILLVQRGSTCGKVAIIDNEIGKATINPSLVVLKKIKCNPFYLFYIIRAGLSELVNLTNNAAIPMLSQEQIGNLKIVLPHKIEQNKIVNYLTKVLNKQDLLILKVKSQINKLKEYRQSIISEAVTGKIDLRKWKAPKKKKALKK